MKVWRPLLQLRRHINSQTAVVHSLGRPLIIGVALASSKSESKGGSSKWKHNCSSFASVSSREHVSRILIAPKNEERARRLWQRSHYDQVRVIMFFFRGIVVPADLLSQSWESFALDAESFFDDRLSWIQQIADIRCLGSSSRCIPVRAGIA